MKHIITLLLLCPLTLTAMQPNPALTFPEEFSVSMRLAYTTPSESTPKPQALYLLNMLSDFTSRGADRAEFIIKTEDDPSYTAAITLNQLSKLTIGLNFIVSKKDGTKKATTPLILPLHKEYTGQYGLKNALGQDITVKIHSWPECDGDGETSMFE